MAGSTTNGQDMIAAIHAMLSKAQSPDYGLLGSIAGAYGAINSGNNVGDAYGAAAGDAADQASTLKTQMDNMPTLEQMYGQNSPYALQMQKTLAAKDAAAGRNSQYGPRLQALQADLASKGSQYAQQQAAMAQAYNTARSNANQQRIQATTGQSQVQGQQLASLFNVGQKSGLLDSANQSLSGALGKGLGSMFPSWGSGGDIQPQYQGAAQQPMDQSVYGGGGNYDGYTTGSNENFQGNSSVPMDQSPYSNYGGNYQDYTTGAAYTPQGNDTQSYNAPGLTDLYDDN